MLTDQKQLIIPQELANALKAEPKAKAKFNRLLFESQLDYSWYVAKTKRPETRIRRADKVIDRLLDSQDANRNRKYMYSKMWEETSDFRNKLYNIFNELLDKHRPSISMELNNDICDARNKVSTLFLSWIGSKKLETKFGIKIPLHDRVIDVGAFMEKQARISGANYIPCDICGEDRITHFCHILPKSYGGPDAHENYVYLCPNHHHLFDNSRLSEEEWNELDFSEKMTQAQEYVKKVREKQQRTYWDNRNKN